MPTGIHSGKIILNEGGNQVADLPLSVSISSFTFPNSFSMGLSTWEYLSGWNKNDNIFNANYFRNHDKLVEIANHYKIDWPFSATTAFSIDIFKLEAKHFDSSGKFIVPTGYYDNFDSWVRKFPNAKKFIISMGLDPALTSHKIFAGANYESQPEIFKARLTGWVDAVESHIVNVLNMQPSQFALFPSDELQIEGDKLVITWIKPLIERPFIFEPPAYKYDYGDELFDWLVTESGNEDKFRARLIQNHAPNPSIPNLNDSAFESVFQAQLRKIRKEHSLVTTVVKTWMFMDERLGKKTSELFRRACTEYLIKFESVH
jgi:hypothetical protein